jgi:quinol monooxygenase YgiN
MKRVVLLLVVALLPLTVLAQDATFYSVSYVEVKPSSRGQAVTALKSYRDAMRRDPGNIRLEVFEQDGREGHFAVVETWKTQGAFDAKAADRQQLESAFEPMRTSGWDTRPYKTLSVASGPETNGKSVFVITHVDVSPNPKVAMLLTSLAEESRTDPGNLRFDVLLHTMRANHFEVIEAWQNDKALELHAAAAHTKQYRDDLQPFLGSPLDERIYKAIE